MTQGGGEGGREVSKEIKYADRAVYFPWRPRSVRWPGSCSGYKGGQQSGQQATLCHDQSLQAFAELVNNRV